MSEAKTASFPFRTEVRVRLPETDAMGIVFHGNYFTYFEVGRVDYLRNLGLTLGVRPIKDFENVVAAAHIDFKSPSRLDDPLTIDVRIKAIGGSSFTFEFEIRHRQQNRLVARGYTTHVAVDDDLKPMRVPDEFRKTIADFEGWESAETRPG
ncbi:MAG: thioesterase family protein [Planctomycetota bacterium]